MIRLPRLAATSIAALAALSVGGQTRAETWKMEGTKQVALHTRDGKTIPIGTINFQPRGDKTHFTFKLDSKPFTVFFLSMRNFDSIEGPDLECIVPYPYDNPMTATPTNLDWLSDNLLFLYKTKAEHAATMANGIRYDLKLTDHGIVGKPQAVNLDDIASPPKDATAAPYGPTDRDDYPDGSRWVETLTIE